MLDHLVAGGLPHNMKCKENIVKEYQEEAGIPKSISTAAAPAGAVSDMDISGYCCKRDVLFSYDLKLTDGFVPNKEDGEVHSFKLIPVNHVAGLRFSDLVVLWASLISCLDTGTMALSSRSPPLED
ncbi:nudix hydrolase 20, chloroplastic-like [Thalictrum thalictroides]|uniref:Nudix hydrolase 20, chloroplastic-like n=1 Tax=Thalictrum thalictroides TaxID=46969 RepID=A0A7J6W265_THATH|nr:nudix hydrolase 20, chloroplastic-like [Thalictrum thalictroides]